MVNAGVLRIWFYRLLFPCIVAVLIFARLLPLQTTPPRWAGPDLILCLTLAWVLRRPAFVPAWLIALVFLACDFLFHRPPGLFAAIAVLGAEFLRGRVTLMRDASFPAEWFLVAAVLLAMLLANRAVLTLTLAGPPPPGLSLMQFAATVLAYPAVVLVSRVVFRVGKPSPHETDRLGGAT